MSGYINKQTGDFVIPFIDVIRDLKVHNDTTIDNNLNVLNKIEAKEIECDDITINNNLESKNIECDNITINNDSNTLGTLYLGNDASGTAFISPNIENDPKILSIGSFKSSQLFIDMAKNEDVHLNHIGIRHNRADQAVLNGIGPSIRFMQPNNSADISVMNTQGIILGKKQNTNNNTGGGLELRGIKTSGLQTENLFEISGRGPSSGSVFIGQSINTSSTHILNITGSQRNEGDVQINHDKGMILGSITGSGSSNLTNLSLRKGILNLREENKCSIRLTSINGQNDNDDSVDNLFRANDVLGNIYFGASGNIGGFNQHPGRISCKTESLYSTSGGTNSGISSRFEFFTMPSTSSVENNKAEILAQNAFTIQGDGNINIERGYLNIKKNGPTNLLLRLNQYDNTDNNDADLKFSNRISFRHKYNTAGDIDEAADISTYVDGEFDTFKSGFRLRTRTSAIGLVTGFLIDSEQKVSIGRNLLNETSDYELKILGSMKLDNDFDAFINSVSQDTNVTQPVTVNGSFFRITTISAEISTSVSFIVNNNRVKSDSIVNCHIQHYTGTYGSNSPAIYVNNIQSGSFEIHITNTRLTTPNVNGSFIIAGNVIGHDV